MVHIPLSLIFEIVCKRKNAELSFVSVSLVTDVIEVTLGASGLWLGTRTGAGGTATLS